MPNSTPTISIPVAKSDVQSSMTGSQGSAASFLQIFRYIHTDLLKSLSQKIPSAEETLQEEKKKQKRVTHHTRIREAEHEQLTRTDQRSYYSLSSVSIRFSLTDQNDAAATEPQRT
jgi:hypothetical protein